jgi:hypothetical protein
MQAQTNRINLNLSLDQVNIALNALNEQPIKVAFSTFSEIQQQATEQLQAAQEQARVQSGQEFMKQELYRMELAENPASPAEKAKK